MNQTISYYNKNASQYYEQTKDVDFSETYKRFLKYVPEGGTVVDLGCGSCRDAAFFVKNGYKSFGVDASESLAAIAAEKTGIKVIVSDMSEWIAEDPLDAAWCCASLLHLTDVETAKFFHNLPNNLKSGGTVFISVKTEVITGIDDKDRYLRNFTVDELEKMLADAGFRLCEIWFSTDKIGRNNIKWINVIASKK